jgi:hypothetical protein
MVRQKGNPSLSSFFTPRDTAGAENNKFSYTESNLTREFIDEHSFVDGQELYRKTYHVRNISIKIL